MSARVRRVKDNRDLFCDSCHARNDGQLIVIETLDPNGHFHGFIICETCNILLKKALNNLDTQESNNNDTDHSRFENIDLE